MQNLDGYLHADEDPTEEGSDFSDGHIIETVAHANIRVGREQRKDHEKKHGRFSKVDRWMESRVQEGLSRQDEGYAQNNSQKPQEVDGSMQTQWLDLLLVPHQIAQSLLPVNDPVPGEINSKKDVVDKQPVGPQDRCPEEGNSPKITEKKRRVANGQEQTAAIAGTEDKKENSVNLILTLDIGQDQRPDEDHSGPRSSDETGQNCAQSNKSRIGRRVGRQVTTQIDPTADHVEAEKEDDEGDELGENSVTERTPQGFPACRGRGQVSKVVLEPSGVEQTIIEKRRSTQDDSHQEAVPVVVPPVPGLREKRGKRR